ncbi:MAG: FAD-dependent thymidylate synthase, partial [Gemmatimonadota bacterium]
RHTTPSEMVELKFHVAMPMFVARQWIRHRTANVNEYSARYSLLPLLFYTPRREDFALQSRSNRQGREGGAPEEVYREAVGRWEALRAMAGEGYAWLIGEDVAREIARIDLPLSTYTQWYWKIDLHNLLHFLTLRVDPHAQLEIREYAAVLAGMVKRVAPLSYEAWVDYDLVGERLSLGERRVLARLVRVAKDGGEADGPALAARDGAALRLETMRELGLSPREARELVQKLTPPERPDFELDLGTMRTAEEVGREMAEAVPEAGG